MHTHSYELSALQEFATFTGHPKTEIREKIEITKWNKDELIPDR